MRFSNLSNGSSLSSAWNLISNNFFPTPGGSGYYLHSFKTFTVSSSASRCRVWHWRGDTSSANAALPKRRDKFQNAGIASLM